jgi:hypothetical protein
LAVPVGCVPTTPTIAFGCSSSGSAAKAAVADTRMVSAPSGNTARVRSGLLRLTLTFAVLFTSASFASATATAAELGDYLWSKRPLLLFAPSDGDPRLVETMNRIAANRCDVVDRDMVIGAVVSEGTSSLDGQTIGADQSKGLMKQYAIEENAFTSVLIGKDGGEKLRVNGVPDLRTIYAVIDGMPMRSREAANSGRRC